MGLVNVGMVVIICGSVFFFQAEDGIRDAQESRGLGDVYKRQVPYWQVEELLKKTTFPFEVLEFEKEPLGVGTIAPVSYTHLTLPTIYSV